jgi:VIT1/CCC1 family predicted Fe2+/Mn2+ transporter
VEHEHSEQAIRERIRNSTRRHNYIRDWVYGGIDGAVTTFAIVSGVVGADLSNKVIVILGLANIVADGFSMAASNFLGTKAEHDEIKHWENVEKRHIEEAPEGEKNEIREIFRQKGFAGADLENAVNVITSSHQQWIQTMLKEEYGLPLEIRSAWLAATATFVSFVLCGFVPLLPYLLGWGSDFVMSSVLTGVVFFAIGSVKSIWSVDGWWESGSKSLLVGALAAALAYGVGYFLKTLV